MNDETPPRRPLVRTGARPLRLEPRMMFDGAAGPEALHLAGAAHGLAERLIAPVHHVPGDPPRPDTTLAASAAARSPHRGLVTPANRLPVELVASTAPVELVFVDTTVTDYQALVADLRPGLEVVLLQPGQDPWQQMTAVIAAHSNVTAVHLICHGADGEMLFGTHAYGAADLGAEAGLLASWRGHLAPGADILVYGCDVGAGAAGQAVVATLARMTGADVAASSDATGAARLGGNWTLETTSGPIETPIAFRSSVYADYPDLLAGSPQTVVVATGTNVDSTASTAGLVGAGKLITFDPMTVTMGATSNALYIRAYDVDYGMKDSSGNPYPIGSPQSEWDGVYIKIHGAADTPSNWKFLGFLNGLNNTWITTTNFDMTAALAALGLSAGQTASLDIRVVPDDNGTQTQANNGGKWVVGVCSAQAIIDGGSTSHTASLGTPTEANAAVSVAVTPTTSATYTVSFSLIDASGHIVAGYNTTTPLTGGTPTTLSGSLSANTTLYPTTAFSNVPNGTYTLQVNVYDSNNVLQDTKSATETITSGSSGTTSNGTPSTTYPTSGSRVTLIGNTSWTGTSTADSAHIATTDATPTLTGYVYYGTSFGTFQMYVDGQLYTGAALTQSSLNLTTVSGHNNVHQWTYTLPSNLSLGQHTFYVSYTRGTTTYTSATYTLSIDSPVQPVISGLTSWSGTSPADLTHTNTTASTTPTISGTATPYVTLYIYDGATLLGATSANSTGAWAYTVAGTTPLSDGTHSLTAVDVTNSTYANRTSTSYTLHIDSVAPTTAVISGSVALSNDTGASATDFVTAAPLQTISATLTAALSGAQQLYASLDGGQTWVNVTSFVSGTSVSWTGQVLRSGYADPSQYTPWSIQFKVSDGQPTPQYGPVTSVDYHLIASLSDPTITRTGWATATTPALYGTADPNSVVTISVGGTTLGTTTPDAKGNWSFTPATPFANGTYTFTVSSADPYSGAISAHTASTTLTIDSTIPVITNIHISSDSGGSATDFITNTATQTITATLSQALNTTNNPQTLWGSVDGGATWTQVAVSGTTITWSNRTLVAGTNEIDFQVRTATAQGAIGAQAYQLDTTAPVLVASGNAATFDSSAGTVTLVFNEAGSGLDANFTPPTSAFSVTGSGGPSVTAVSVDPATNSVTLTVNGTVTGVTYTRPGSGNTLRDVAGNAVATFTKTGIVDVSNDVTPPAAPTLALKPDAGVSDTGKSATDDVTANGTPAVRVSLPGTGAAASAVGDIVDLYASGVNVGEVILTAANITAGYVDITTADLGADATLNMTATETDAAGNVSTASTPLVVTLDRTAPTVNTAAANGTTLVLYINETGSGLSTTTPAPGDFTVTRNGTTLDTVTAVSVNPTTETVTLTLSTATLSSDTITVSYTGGANKLQDVAGNVFANFATQSVINNNVDVTPPAAPSIALNAASDSGSSNTDAITNVGSPSVHITLNGTGATAPVVGDTLTLYLGGSPLGTTVRLTAANIVNGYVDVTTAPLGADGVKSLTATITDAAGNISSSSAPLSVTLDTTPPAAPTVALTTDSFGAGTTGNATDKITNVGTLSVTGTETGALVEYSADGVSGWSTTAPALAQGSNTVYVRQTDVAGNVSAATAFTFTYDTQVSAPTVALATDSGTSGTDKITNVGTLSVTGTETGALVEYSANGTSGWSTTAPALTQGSNTVYVRQTDLAGNVSAATAFTFTYDTQVSAPTVALAQDTGTSGSDKITNVGTLSVTGTETGALVEYSADGVSGWSTTAPALAQGSNTVYVRQTDLAGNVSVATAFTFTYDTQVSAPNVALATDSGASGTDKITNVGTLSVTGTETGALVEYSANGTSGWSTTAPALTQGSNTVYVRQTDLAGNVSAATAFRFTFDNVPPAPASVTAATTDSPQPTLGGSAVVAAGETLSITVAGHTYTVGDGHLTFDGVHWTLVLPTLTAGTYPVAAIVTDTAGNTTTTLVQDGLTVEPNVPPPFEPTHPTAPAITSPAPAMAQATAIVERGPDPAPAAHAPADAGEPTLLADVREVFHQEFQADAPVVWVTLPTDTFVQTDASPIVLVTASMADGSALPGWLVFDAERREFRGVPPAGFRGELLLRVVARDDAGRVAETYVRVRVGRDTTANVLPAKPSLSAQLRAAHGPAAGNDSLLSALRTGGRRLAPARPGRATDRA